MKTAFQEAIKTAESGQDLPADQMRELIDTMLRGQADDASVGRLLLALRAKGEAVSELVGAVRAMRAHMTPIGHDLPVLVDTCGTGGDGSGTFNISTAAAVVVAAAGVPVAKHGNRRITSVTGSADVLGELGVEFDVPREVVERSLREAGICFCFAPRLHPAMKHVAQVRRSLGVPTLFNYLGPLCNPAGASVQVLGTGSPAIQRKLAESLAQLGMNRAAVVRGEDGLDEVTLSGATDVRLVEGQNVLPARWDVSDFGLAEARTDAMLAGSPGESACRIREILDGQPGPCRDITVANAAAALWIAGAVPDLRSGAEKAAAAIDSGAARQTLQKLAEVTSAPAS